VVLTLVTLMTSLLAFLAYALTACRTISWWEGSSYALAASTLGITGPPGSLLLTLIGWVAYHVPLVDPVAFRLNLVNSLIAAAAAAVVTRLSIGLSTPPGQRPAAADLFAGCVAGLAFAFSLSVWGQAVRFVPYVLSAAFAALILAVATAWWRRGAREEAAGAIFLIFLLLGLDFSVHRTNVLLLPAILAWLTLRRPGGWLKPARWGALIGGLALGLAFHLLLIPIARRHPWFDIGEPRDLARFWDYVSLKMMGGGFLVRLWPRSADFVTVQLADYGAFLEANLAPAGGWPPASLLAAALILLGWVACFRSDSRRALGLLVFYLCASLGAVVYFNMPAHYFRAMDRHYVPSLALLAPMLGVGASWLLRRAAAAPGGLGRALAPVAAILLVLVPANALRANYRTCDLSRVRLTEAYARNALQTLPLNALLLTNGDNDTFPLWFLQRVEGVRPDVTVINLSLTNTGWFPAQLRRKDPSLAGLLDGREPPDPRMVQDSTVHIELPDRRGGFDARLQGLVLGQDFVALDLLRRVGGKRPLCVACTVPPQVLAWLWPHLRPDGLAYRFALGTEPPDGTAGLRRKLLGRMDYTGVADSSIVLDEASRQICGNYVAVLGQLAYAQFQAGDGAGCLETLGFIDARVPPARLGADSKALGELRTDALALTRK
jgi:hypothetical protein